VLGIVWGYMQPPGLIGFFGCAGGQRGREAVPRRRRGDRGTVPVRAAAGRGPSPETPLLPLAHRPRSFMLVNVVLILALYKGVMG
jgi:hypothetical protein